MRLPSLVWSLKMIQNPCFKKSTFPARISLKLATQKAKSRSWAWMVFGSQSLLTRLSQSLCILASVR